MLEALHWAPCHRPQHHSCQKFKDNIKQLLESKRAAER
ncbi:hypothetical protein SynA1840_02185 [Synechococcus sp. A18-40]|nr:hypothetical protein SynA1840_02185 [Synechococcus sp. A18-40]